MIWKESFIEQQDGKLDDRESSRINHGHSIGNLCSINS